MSYAASIYQHRRQLSGLQTQTTSASLIVQTKQSQPSLDSPVLYSTCPSICSGGLIWESCSVAEPVVIPTYKEKFKSWFREHDLKLLRFRTAPKHGGQESNRRRGCPSKSSTSGSKTWLNHRQLCSASNPDTRGIFVHAQSTTSNITSLKSTAVYRQTIPILSAAWNCQKLLCLPATNSLNISVGIVAASSHPPTASLSSN
jgi:hypothetical protein